MEPEVMRDQAPEGQPDPLRIEERMSGDGSQGSLGLVGLHGEEPAGQL